MKPNGQRSENTSREERWQKRPERFHLQQSPSATDGSHDGEERTQSLLVHLENSTKDRTLHLQKAETVEDVRQGIFREIPDLSSNKFVLRFFLTPKGSLERTPIEGSVLPTISELYATVYLFKH
jgi:hypothetical protein